MPSLDSPAILVARFLRTNGFSETLSAFLEEAGLPPDAGAGSSGDITIEQILQEKKNYDLSVGLEKLGEDVRSLGWTRPAPNVPSILTLPTSTNLLSTSLRRLYTSPDAAEPQDILLSTTADRRLNIMSASGPTYEMLDSHLGVLDSPILAHTAVKHRFLICTSMSGKVCVFDVPFRKVVSSRKDHTKYVVQIVSHEADDGAFVATAGWDGKIFLYRARLLQDLLDLGDPIGSISLPSSPEALVFARDGGGRLFLIATRKDSSFLFYYQVPGSDAASGSPRAIELHGKQNLAPLSNAWVAFTPAAMELCPTDASLLAVATSTVPHMKLLIVRLLFPANAESEVPNAIAADAPTVPSSTGLDSDAGRGTLAVQQARKALAVQDREANAVLMQVTTMAPQTHYSTPALAWRPDGTGVWVNSDDGVVRGIEAASGKVIATLEGHEPGCKIRCMWAGMASSAEVVVTGAFDQRLILWRPDT